MSLKISFLGSGSRGNCTLVETAKYKFLIDAGFSLRRTNELLHQCGTSLENISAVILTHTHDDHLKRAMLNRMHKSNIALICRPEHGDCLNSWDGYQWLRGKNLVRHYGQQRFEMLPELMVEPIPLSHDAPATHGFIFDFKLGHSALRFAYVADCGFASLANINAKVHDAHLIALEFNHDEEMERSSGRPRYLINRVLGPQGHLSNVKAANWLKKVQSKNLRQVVQLHLSRDCNLPTLAMNAARMTMGDMTIGQTCQDQIGPIIQIN